MLQSAHGVPVHLYGQGVAKSIHQLWTELQEGETKLVVSEGNLAREVQIVTVRVKDTEQRVCNPQLASLSTCSLAHRTLIQTTPGACN